MMDDHGDITDTLAPKSEQLDNVELSSGPRVFVVERVEVKKDAEQPVRVYFHGFPRPWRPGVTMRRVLGYCWGNKSKFWAGRSIQLFRDPDVRYGKDNTGGTRIAAMSHIDGRQEVPVLLSQGRAGTYIVEPLAEEADPIAACSSIDELRAMYRTANDETRARITARVAELQAAEATNIPAASVPGGSE